MIKLSQFTFLLFLLFFQACKTTQQVTVNTARVSLPPTQEDTFAIDTKPIFNPSMEEKKVAIQNPKSEDLSKKETVVVKPTTTPKKPQRKRIAVYQESIDEEMKRMMDEQMGDFKGVLPSAEVERLTEMKIRISFDPNIYFFHNSTEFTPDALQKVAIVSGILKKYEGCEVLIEGHEDKNEHALQHYELSEKRGLYFLEYIVSLGIERERVSFMGYGTLKTTNEIDHRLNRRIHLIITVDEQRYTTAKK